MWWLTVVIAKSVIVLTLVSKHVSSWQPTACVQANAVRLVQRRAGNSQVGEQHFQVVSIEE